MCLLVIAAIEYQIQVCIPAHNSSEFFYDNLSVCSQIENWMNG